MDIPHNNPEIREAVLEAFQWPISPPIKINKPYILKIDAVIFIKRSPSLMKKEYTKWVNLRASLLINIY